MGDAHCEEVTEPLREEEPQGDGVMDALGQRETVAHAVAVVVSVMERLLVPDTDTEELALCVPRNEALAEGQRDTVGDREGEPVSEKERLLVGDGVDVRHSEGDAHCEEVTEPLREEEPQGDGVMDALGHREAVAHKEEVVVSVMERLLVGDTLGEAVEVPHADDEALAVAV